MDSRGNIYPISDLSMDQIDTVETKEDVARLDGFLRGRSEAVKLSGSRRHETLVHNSSGSKTYKKERNMGIEGVSDITGNEQTDTTPRLPTPDEVIKTVKNPDPSAPVPSTPAEPGVTPLEAPTESEPSNG